MSQWKDKEVIIKQIMSDGDYYDHIYGLGSDGKVYKWDRNEGAWEKYWYESDRPA